MDKKCGIEILEIGLERNLAVIVDGFAADPDRWRSEAAQCDYRPMGDFYPGDRTPVGPAYLADVGPALGQVFREIYGCRERMSVQRALYSVASTAPCDLGLAQRIPHFDDTGADRYAMVHYLAREDMGGTAFYRQRSTGYESVSPERHTRYLARLNEDFAIHGEPEPGYIAGDTPLFEQVAAVEHRYNRAVIYPASLLHCSQLYPDIAYSPDPAIGRLTVAAFMLAK